jgi:hypothetical protein
MKIYNPQGISFATFSTQISIVLMCHMLPKMKIIIFPPSRNEG